MAKPTANGKWQVFLRLDNGKTVKLGNRRFEKYEDALDEAIKIRITKNLSAFVDYAGSASTASAWATKNLI